MAEIAKLRRAAQKANAALYAAEAKATDKLNAKLLGRCFKFQNSGGGCEGKWWLYAKVVKVENGHLRCFKFERMPNGNITIEPDQYTMASHLTNAGYQEIAPIVWHDEWRELRDHLATEL